MKGIIVAIKSAKIKLFPPTSKINPLNFGAIPVIPIILTKMFTATNIGTIFESAIPPSLNPFPILTKVFLIPDQEISESKNTIIRQKQELFLLQ
jgi:hypothetical protein